MKMHDKPTGSFVALVTPMNEDGTIDISGFKNLIQFQQENGTSAVLIMGSTGEVSMLTTDEKKQIISETSKMKSEKIKIYFGCTGNNTESTIEMVKFAKNQGADGAIIAAPSYVCASRENIKDYVLEVCDSTDLPIGFYNNPPRINTDLHWNDLIEISKHPNMVVLKESTTRVGQVAQMCLAKPDISIMCCCSPNLGLIVPTMSLGGHGTANMTGNIIPKELSIISKPWENYADATKFKDEYLKNLDILHFAYSSTNPVPIKTLMRAIGLPAGPLRKPLKPISKSSLNAGIELLSKLSLDKSYGYKINMNKVA